MESIQKQRNYILDIVKGFAIINIVFIHTVWWSGQVYMQSDLIRQLSLFIDVPLFFFLSGWATSLHEQSFKTTLKRFIKLCIPYAITIATLTLALTVFYKRSISFQTIWGWLTLTFRESFELPVVMGSMWFLAPFIIISILTPVLMRIVNMRNLSAFFIIFLLLLNFLFNSYETGIGDIVVLNLISIRVIVFYLLFYYLGIYTRDMTLNIKEFIYIIISLTFLLGLCLCYFNFKLDLQANKFPPSALYLIASTYSVVATLYLKNFEEKASQKINKNNKILKFLQYSGKNAYNLYLYQGFGGSIIFYIAYNANIIMLPKGYKLVLSFICNLAITYALAFTFGKLNNLALKPVNKYFR